MQTQLPNEIIVVGRETDEAARGIIEEESKYTANLCWVEVEIPGHIPPVIRGLEESTGDIVVFLDDDAEPCEGWLEALVRPFEDATIACVGGRVETLGFYGHVHRDAGQIRWYGKHVGNVAMRDGDGSMAVASVMECNWAWRREVLRSLEFDPVFAADDASMYGLDLCLQASAKGYGVVYEPRARVVHHAAPRDDSLDRGDRPQRMVTYSRNYTYTVLRHLRGLRRIAFLTWWWLIGERGSYGALTGMYDFIARGSRHTVPLVWASLKGKWEGVLEWATRCR